MSKFWVIFAAIQQIKFDAMKIPQWKTSDIHYQAFPRQSQQTEGSEGPRPAADSSHTRCCFICAILIFTILSTAIVVYHYNRSLKLQSTFLQTHVTSKWRPNSCDAVRDDLKFDCLPRGAANAESCAARGCCWSPRSTNQDPVPWCYYPKSYQTYKVVNITYTSRGVSILLNNTKKSVYPNDIQLLFMKVTFESQSRLHVKVSYAATSIKDLIEFDQTWKIDHRCWRSITSKIVGNRSRPFSFLDGMGIYARFRKVNSFTVCLRRGRAGRF